MKKLGFSQQLLNKREIFNEGRGADERAIYCKLKMYTSFNAKHMQIFLFFPPSFYVFHSLILCMLNRPRKEITLDLLGNNIA